MTAQIFVGDEQQMTFTFKNLSGVLSNPTTISLTLMRPDGTLISPVYTQADMTNVSTGVWRFLYTFDEDGRWRYRLVTTGTPKKAFQDYVDVAHNPFSEA